MKVYGNTNLIVSGLSTNELIQNNFAHAFGT